MFVIVNAIMGGWSLNYVLFENSFMKLEKGKEHDVVTAKGTQITKLGQVSSPTRWKKTISMSHM